MKRENTADDRDTRKAIVDKKIKIKIEETRAASTPNKAAERRPNVSTEPTIYIALLTPAPDDMALVTPMK